MESLYAKMKEYTKMDTEISAAEFFEYYKQVMEELAGDFGNFTETDLFQGKAVTSIMAANAAARAKRKNADAKKFKKIHEKSKFWADAMDYRLKKMGFSEEEIGKRVAALDEGDKPNDRDKPDESDKLNEGDKTDESNKQNMSDKQNKSDKQKKSDKGEVTAQ